MVIEIAMLPVKADQISAFLEGWKSVAYYLSSQPGYVGHQMGPQAEDKNLFVLQVTWQTLADHHAFMASADYAPFGAGFGGSLGSKPTVWHFEPQAGL